MDGRPFQLTDVSRSFGAVEALRDVSLTIERGEFVALVGPSGCGKTTLLNILAGDDNPSSGEIGREGRMRMVYQQDGLFPWQTVAENVALGLRHIADPRERRRQAEQMIRLIQVEGFEDHYPHQLARRCGFRPPRCRCEHAIPGARRNPAVEHEAGDRG